MSHLIFTGFFILKLKIAEDTTFLLRLCLKTEDIVIEERAKYYYRKRNESLTKKVNAQSFYNEIEGLKEKIDALSARGYDSYSIWYIAAKNRYYLSRWKKIYSEIYNELFKIINKPEFSAETIKELEELILENRLLSPVIPKCTENNIIILFADYIKIIAFSVDYNYCKLCPVNNGYC